MDFVVRHSSKMSCKPMAPKSENCSSYEVRIFWKYISNIRSYLHWKYLQKAIKALNNLLPNSAFLQNVVTQQRSKESFNVIDTEMYLNRAGMTVKDLEKLKVIHISGTKGKVCHALNINMKMMQLFKTYLINFNRATIFSLLISDDLNWLLHCCKILKKSYLFLNSGIHMRFSRINFTQSWISNGFLQFTPSNFCHWTNPFVWAPNVKRNVCQVFLDCLWEVRNRCRKSNFSWTFHV